MVRCDATIGVPLVTLRPRDTQQLAEMLLDAHDRSAPMRIVGRGAWLHGGGRVSPTAAHVRLEGLTGIVEYVPGDLTLTARAGTSLAEIENATAAHHQWCPLQPWGDDKASLGAVFATATAGPFAQSLGRPRDLALGLEFVDGTGATVRAGGRVVKNVAGFDLTRLLVGAWGSLGAITEVSVRLRARPRVDETWAVAFDTNDPAATVRRTAFERGPLAPLALRQLRDTESGKLGLAPSRTLLTRLGGNASFVAAARAAVLELGDAEQCSTETWQRYRAIHEAELATNLDLAIADPLSQRVKRKFDPRRIMNPGILGEPSA